MPDCNERVLQILLDRVFEHVQEAPVLVDPCESVLDGQPAVDWAPSSGDAIGEPETLGVSSILSRVEPSIRKELDASDAHEHLGQRGGEEGDVRFVRREGARTYDDSVVIDDGGELESSPSTVGRVPSEARGSPVLVLDEGGVEFVPPRGMSGGVGLQTTDVRLLEQTCYCPSVRVLEYGDVGGGLWRELPPLHSGADEPEERIQGILWVEDARSSSSLRGERLLHKREESLLVRLRQSHMPKTCKNNFETDPYVRKRTLL